MSSSKTPTPAPSSSPDLSILTSPALPNLPSPTLFDFIPLTHDLLSRLTSTFSTSQPSSGPTLEIKDLETEASRIRVKILKAKQIVAELPDVERGVDEQDVEIHELEARVGRLREILEGVRGLGVEGAK